MNLTRRLILIPALCLTLGAVAARGSEPTQVASASPSASINPISVVESLHGVLLGCMQGACGPDFDGRYDRIASQLDGLFDMPFMARISIGKAWSALSPDERSEFVALSRSLSASNYAANFNSYGGQHFETLGEEPAARGTIVVRTEFVQPTDENVKFDYRLRKADTGWRIIDITLDGKVSEITMRRADYRSVIERNGYSKLVEALEKKIAKLADE